MNAFQQVCSHACIIYTFASNQADNLTTDLWSTTLTLALVKFGSGWGLVCCLHEQGGDLGWLVESGALDSCPPNYCEQSSLPTLTWVAVLTHPCPFKFTIARKSLWILVAECLRLYAILCNMKVWSISLLTMSTPGICPCAMCLLWCTMCFLCYAVCLLCYTLCFLSYTVCVCAVCVLRQGELCQYPGADELMWIHNCTPGVTWRLNASAR